MKGRKLVFVVALVALVVVAVVAVAWAAPVGVGGDRQRPTPPVALKCQSGTACGGAPVAAEYPSHIKGRGRVSEWACVRRCAVGCEVSERARVWWDAAETFGVERFGAERFGGGGVPAAGDQRHVSEWDGLWRVSR